MDVTLNTVYLSIKCTHSIRVYCPIKMPLSYLLTLIMALCSMHKLLWWDGGYLKAHQVSSINYSIASDVIKFIQKVSFLGHCASIHFKKIIS